jgi:hypothetical protein
MMEWQLTEKALFPESDIEAAKNVCASLGVVIDFMDKMVKQVNRDPEVLELWEIGKGLQAAAEIYYAGGPDNV